MRIIFLMAGLALAAGIILLINYAVDGPSQPIQEVAPEIIEVEQETSTVVPPPPVVSAPIAVESSLPELILPPLDDSDEFVRSALIGSSLPESWLGRDDLLRRLAVVVENAGRGEYPRRQLGFLAPEGKFQIRKQGDTLFIDPVGYRRYDHYLDALESVSTEALSQLLTNADELLDAAMNELGSDRATAPQLIDAIDQILAVPVIRNEIELVQPKVFFEYADAELEGLSPLQKQVLRMGPDNVTRLQTYVEALRSELTKP